MEGRLADGSSAFEGNTVYNTYKNSRVDHSSHIHGDCIHNTNHHYHSHRSSEGPQDRLEKYVSKGAAHDSAERGTDAPKCFPETREAVQGEMLSFVDPGGKEKILWLTGPAGAGKTAIAGSIADECHARGWLAGSFFFSVSANKVDRCSKRYLIPTLAYYLFQLNIPGLPAAILASIEANPSVFDKRLDQQVEILLLKPLREVVQKYDPSTWPKVVIVDGVDECAADEGRDFETEHERQMSRESNQHEVLSALAFATREPAFPFRIIIASRAESAIQGYFSLRTVGIEKIVLDSTYNPQADIELYLRAMLIRIGRGCCLPEHWYNHVVPEGSPADVPQYLAEAASEQFVYAATAIGFIQDNSEPPQKRLEQVLNCWRGSDPSKPFAALDALYTRIMQNSPKPSSAALFIATFEALLSRRSDLDSRWQLKAILESFPGEAEHLMGPLKSLVCLMHREQYSTFYLYHRSLFDFLKDPERSGALYVPSSQVRDYVAGRCYEILKTTGQRVPLPPGHTLDHFLPVFCKFFAANVPRRREHNYDREDVDWWLTTLMAERGPPVASATIPSTCVPEAFASVHLDCHWYACKPACKVWRKVILQFAKANDWRVPTMLEMLRNRMKPREINVAILWPSGEWALTQPL